MSNESGLPMILLGDVVPNPQVQNTNHRLFDALAFNRLLKNSSLDAHRGT